MTAKEYLSQLITMDNAINRKQQRSFYKPRFPKRTCLSDIRCRRCDSCIMSYADKRQYIFTFCRLSVAYVNIGTDYRFCTRQNISRTLVGLYGYAV